MFIKSLRKYTATCAGALALLVSTMAWSADKPNILVIWGDDIGTWNLSAYNLGSMGFETPNIDRIAQEGALFTDYYGENSCTAGRSAFITGQHPIRTGLTKVGSPGRDAGLQKEVLPSFLWVKAKQWSRMWYKSLFLWRYSNERYRVVYSTFGA